MIGSWIWNRFRRSHWFSYERGSTSVRGSRSWNGELILTILYNKNPVVSVLVDRDAVDQLIEWMQLTYPRRRGSDDNSNIIQLAGKLPLSRTTSDPGSSPGGDEK